MREKVINLGRFGLRKHTEIAENTEISFSNTDLTRSACPLAQKVCTPDCKNLHGFFLLKQIFAVFRD